ncbi:MAG: radical SAM protein [Candidatus Acidiferrales bacterium]
MATLPTLPAPPAPSTIRSNRSEQTSLTLFPTAACHGGSQIACAASTPTPTPHRSSNPAAELVGIARLAASSPCADAKRGTEYFLLPVRSIVNHCDSGRVPFNWTINPYRGCEFGCQYCYARYTHEYMELDGADFEKKIYAKKDAGELVSRDLMNPKLQGEHIAIGTATDPYQPAEREFGATRAILERMAEREGLSLSITTKSNQVLRDIDLLQKISERSSITINMSITTLRTRLARLLEPRAPRPDLRVEAVNKLREAGIAAGVFAMPVLPGITDREADLDALARAARDAGALWFAANVLFLMPSSQKQFLPFIAAKFPRLVRQYEEWYVRRGGSPQKYKQEISERIHGLQRKYGLGSRPTTPTRPAHQPPQMSLGLSLEPRARFGAIEASMALVSRETPRCE